MFVAAEDFARTAVTITPKLGTGADGDLYGPEVSREVYIEDARQLVRDATGEQVVSETTLYADLDDDDVFTPDSQVGLPGRTAQVLNVKRLVIGDADVDHLEVVLT